MSKPFSPKGRSKRSACRTSAWGQAESLSRATRHMASSRSVATRLRALGTKSEVNPPSPQATSRASPKSSHCDIVRTTSS